MPLQINTAAINELTTSKQLGQIAWQAAKNYHSKTLNAKVVAALVLGSLTGVGLLVTAPASVVILVKAYKSYREALRQGREAQNALFPAAAAINTLPEEQGQVVQARVNERTPLLAQPQSTAREPLRVTAFFKQYLDNGIIELEKLLENNRWGYAGHPGPYLESLVKLENIKKPGFNLVQCGTPTKLAEQIATCIKNRVGKAQFLVQLEEGTLNHTVAVSYQLVGDTPSVLAFEPANFEDGGNALPLHYGLKSALSTLKGSTGEKLRFSNIGMQIQSSYNQCGLFALNIAKQNWRKPEALAAIHERHVAGEFASRKFKFNNPYINTENMADIAHLLPVELLKHAQSGTRLNDHLNKNPNLLKEVVNKKGETLEQYRDRHNRLALVQELFGPSDLIVRNASMYDKQLAYMKEVSAAVVVDPDEPTAN